MLPDFLSWVRGEVSAEIGSDPKSGNLPVSSGIGVRSLDNGPRCLMVSPDRSRGHYRRQELVVDLNADPHRVSLVVTLEK